MDEDQFRIIPAPAKTKVTNSCEPTEYIWRTQGDDKVRSGHAEREGKVFRYDQPPEGGNPGEAINCRCWAEPLVDNPRSRDTKTESEEMVLGRAPGLSEQFNPSGARENPFSRDYRRWFEARFPNTIAGARKLLSHRVEQEIREGLRKGQQVNGEKLVIADVDIQPDMQRFCDEPQGLWEQEVRIGAFEIDIENIEITYKETDNDKIEYNWTARMYIREQTGVGRGEKFEFLEPLFGKRVANYGEWSISGNGTYPF